MHILLRETRSLDEGDVAVDLAQSPADLVFLSYADSDLSAVAAAWSAGRDSLPSLRLASLAKLRHPMSVDLYVEQVVSQASCVVVRLLGGIDYWRYGAEELAHACSSRGIPLALLPGDGRADARLADLSTVDRGAASRLDLYFTHGGPAQYRRRLAADGASGRSWRSAGGGA